MKKRRDVRGGGGGLRCLSIKTKTMKTARNSRIGFGVISFILVQMLYSCYDHEINVTEPPDYFPLSEGSSADYVKEYLNTADQTIWATYTVTLTVSGDTLIDGLSYKKIINEFGLLEKVARVKEINTLEEIMNYTAGFQRNICFSMLTSPRMVHGSTSRTRVKPKQNML